MSNCGRCDLQRIYKQFAEKKAKRDGILVVNTAQEAPEVVSVKAVEEIKEPEVVVIQEVKKVSKSKKKKDEEPIEEKIETSTEGDNSEAI